MQEYFLDLRIEPFYSEKIGFNHLIQVADSCSSNLEIHDNESM